MVGETENFGVVKIDIQRNQKGGQIKTNSVKKCKCGRETHNPSGRCIKCENSI
jgi:hypothetical protein